MPRSLQDAVVVITGASSGIGRATAHAFAEQGARLALASRSESDLQAVAQECEQRGAHRVIYALTDTSDEAAVRRLSRTALDTFGRIDVWVNDAAVALYGRFEDSPPELFQQVIQTNFFGYVYGARAVIPHFRQQGHGTLINVASVVGVINQPFASAYVTSKHAVRALGACLRQEQLDQKDVHICTVMPAAIDTPFFQHAGNYFGREVVAPPPTYAPERVAATIVSLAQKPRREVFVGGAARLFAIQHVLNPALTEWLGAKQFGSTNFGPQPASNTPGAIVRAEPGTDNMRGGWQKQQATVATGALAVAGAGIAALGSALVLWNRLRSRSTSGDEQPARKLLRRAA